MYLYISTLIQGTSATFQQLSKEFKGPRYVLNNIKFNFLQELHFYLELKLIQVWNLSLDF